MVAGTERIKSLSYNSTLIREAMRVMSVRFQFMLKTFQRFLFSKAVSNSHRPVYPAPISTIQTSTPSHNCWITRILTLVEVILDLGSILNTLRFIVEIAGSSEVT